MFSVIGDKVRFVGTDGKRLAMCEKCGIDTTKFIDSKERFNTSNITIPVTGLQQILKILNTFENIELANIEVSKNHLFFSMDSVVLSILLADGRFPPYEKAMPKDLKNKIVINTKVFLSALKQTCCLAYSKNRTVQLILDSENINISTRSEANGEAKVDIPAKYDGESFMTVLNPDFLMDVLKIVEKEEIEILVKDRESAILLQDGEGFSYILLPIKTEKD
jgi:DNA polymerase-3 subunit beta